MKRIHTHMLDFSICGIRLIVQNSNPVLDWDEWFNENPAVRKKLAGKLKDLLLGQLESTPFCSRKES